MVQRYSSKQTKYENVESVPDSVAPIVCTSPRAIVRGPDGKGRWVACCPRCSDRNDEGIVAGDEGSARATCKCCGAIVEIRESGVYVAAPTMPPPED